MKSVLKGNSFVLCLLLLFVSCKEKDLVTSILPSEPIVRLLSPQNNQVISDSVTIQIETYDDKGIKHLSVFIDDNYQFSDNKNDTIHNFFWNTSYLTEGSHHKIKALGEDGEGHITASKEIDIVVYHFTPSNLIARLLTDSTIELTWQDNSKYETGFEIEQAGSDSIFTKIATLDSNETKYIVKGNFSPEQEISFRMRAFSKVTVSGYSNIAKTSLFLSAPSNLTVYLTSDTTALVNWYDNSFYEDAFEIEMSRSNGDPKIVKFSEKNKSSFTFETVFHLDALYIFRIRAKRGNYYSEYSNIATSTLFFPPPGNLSISQTSSSPLKLHWTDNSSFEEGFVIERKTELVDYTEIGRVNKNVTSYVDNSLDGSLEYKYRIFGYTKHNQSASSALTAINAPTIFPRYVITTLSSSSFALSQDEKKIAINDQAKGTRLISIYDAVKGELLDEIKSGNIIDKILSNVAFSYDGVNIAGVNSSKELIIWNSHDKSILRKFNVGQKEGYLEFSNDLRTLGFATYGKMEILDYQDGSSKEIIINTGLYELTHFTFSHNGKFIALWNSSGISLWYKNTLSKFREFNSNETQKNATFSFDDKYLITSNSRSISAWDVNSGLLVKKIVTESETGAVVMSYDDKLLFAVQQKSINCYLFSTGEKISQLDIGEAQSPLKATKDGQRLFLLEPNYFYNLELNFNWRYY